MPSCSTARVTGWLTPWIVSVPSKVELAVAPSRHEGVAGEVQLGVVLDVEEVRRAQVVVAALLTGVDARRVDRYLDRRLLGRLTDRDVAGERRKTSLDLGHHHVPDDEADMGVRHVDGEHAGGRKLQALDFGDCGIGRSCWSSRLQVVGCSSDLCVHNILYTRVIARATTLVESARLTTCRSRGHHTPACGTGGPPVDPITIAGLVFKGVGDRGSRRAVEPSVRLSRRRQRTVVRGADPPGARSPGRTPADERPRRPDLARTPSGLTRAVDRLAEQGRWWRGRRARPTAGRPYAALTERGRSDMGAFLPRHEEFLAALLQGVFSVEEEQQLMALLPQAARPGPPRRRPPARAGGGRGSRRHVGSRGRCRPTPGRPYAGGGR